MFHAITFTAAVVAALVTAGLGGLILLAALRPGPKSHTLRRESRRALLPLLPLWLVLALATLLLFGEAGALGGGKRRDRVDLSAIVLCLTLAAAMLRRKRTETHRHPPPTRGG